ncbi:MAG: right-handed parallel beta-helix repeat-containing protein, partial [Thermoplasmata archaeon]
VLVFSGIAVVAFQSSSVSSIKIDGIFDDWQGVAKTKKARDVNVPENIDIEEYATVETGKNVAFYAKVYGNLLAGDGRYIVEAPSENPVYVANHRETAIPNANGRDVAYVFVDTDNNPATGFKPSRNFAVGADKAIEIVGKNGRIEVSRVLTFAGAMAYEWAWDIGDSVPAATNGKELETMAGKGLLGACQHYAVYFYMFDWKNRASATLEYTQVSENGRTTYHDIVMDASLSEWDQDENMGGRDNVSWYFTWNETSLFVGCARGGTFHGGNDDYDVLWLYLDTETGGTTTSVDWNGQHALPFAADWCFVFKPTPYGDPNYYWNLRHWNGSEWQIDMPYTGNDGYPAWHWDNGIAEIELPLSDIGNPAQVNILFYMTNGASNYLFGASPMENPTGTSPQTLLSYWIIDNLEDGISPNTAMKWTVPFAVNGDAALSAKAADWSWAGDGSEANPYIIERYKIVTYSGTYGIQLQNTNLHVVIRNCEFENVSGGTNSAGILLTTATNVTIRENIVYGHTFGIWLQTNSAWNTVKDNTVYGNKDGIRLTTSRNNTLDGNEAFGNTRAGIYLTGTKPENNTIINNWLHDNGQYGIDVYGATYANNTKIMYNNISNNGNYGIYIANSYSNIITYNWFYNNTQYAIYITSSATDNYIHHNNFIANNGTSKGNGGNSQAYDSASGNYWYDNTVNEGNYWSNWDGNGNGTANAYPIAGGTASDWYPLGSPVVAEFSAMPLFLLALGCVFVLARVRKQTKHS